MATVSNLVIDQGSDFSAIISLRNQDTTPIDLTHYTVKSQFRKSYQSSSYKEFTVTVIDAQNGKIRLFLSANTSSDIQPGRYLYDVEITSASGDRRRALEGLIILTPEITRS